MSDAEYVRDTKAEWLYLLDRFNDGKIPPISIALWASLHVDRNALSGGHHE